SDPCLENLQKKMAERPTAANRQMAKRAREPLAETNSVISEPPVEKVLPSSKPSPSKRRCSEENMTGEENKEPVALQVSTSEIITDKKPPVLPSSIRSATVEKGLVSSGSESATGPACLPPSTNKMMACQSQTVCADKVIKHSVMVEDRETPKDIPAQNVSSMRSRLQRLADQRHYWDSEGSNVPESDVPSPLKPQRTEIPTTPAPTLVSSGPSVGRKGRLANLAATINSWEDDLGPQPTHKDNAGHCGTTNVPPPALAKTNVTKTSPAEQQSQPVQPANKPVYSTQQAPVYSPVKSSRVIPPSPQKTEMPEPKLAKGLNSPASSPMKSYSSHPSTPVKSAITSSSPRKTPLSQSPLRSQTPGKDFGSGKVFSPIKPNLPAKPSSVTAPVSHTNEKLAKETAHLQPNNQGGVKSFLERFGERCQERQGSPTVGQIRTPVAQSVTSSAKSKMFQERIATTQTASTTAMLTQKQKLEREAELAQVRNRFHAGNMWKSKEDLAEITNDVHSKEVLDESPDPVLCSETSKHSLSILETPSKISEPEILILSFHFFTEAEEEIREIEMNVDGSINSEVINDLFDGVLEDNEEGEEEDALNISSMSLLAPVVETVAAVVKSPERKHMTSTPASSFIHKSGTPESASRPTKFQRARLPQAGTSDGTENVEGQKLLYSIDAYRSTRVKDTERPQVKQVIVRKEDVSKRGEEPQSPSHISIKQKMQILTNEMNLQQTVIHQASQALNCCTDEEHGKGSPVEAEAERLLLIAIIRMVVFGLAAFLNMLTLIFANLVSFIVMASPGGPNAVRTSNFVLVGSHKLTLASIGKNKFPMEKVPFLCPLEGHIYLKIQCEVGSRVEERGFLTMFEDVSGFGSWHRRWCVLSGYCISYWTYPDDEKRKSPIGRINLACCTSRKVEPANREFCARPNTFELITVRPQRENDKETLVSQCKNTMCVTKNWLSSDTKEERNLWMQKLNQILVDLRMWQPDSCYRPA
uniref:Anillin n=1 Tax=Astyanax mexicanus TaxID=7994 RepID=A0A8B9HVU2_ASTMX